MDMFNIMAEDDHFVYIMWTILFYAALWFSGVLFELIGGAGLVAEIIVGIILGPSLLNIVPEPDVNSNSSFQFILLFKIITNLDFNPNFNF